MTEKAFDQLREEGLKSFITDIHNEVLAISRTDVPSLHEHIFKEVFLPLFAGDDPLPYPVNLDTWVKMAGGYAKAVQVVDSNGAVLFTVPGILDMAAVTPIAGGRASIAHVIQSADQYARIHPKEGARYLEAQLRDRAMVMRLPPHALEHLEAWNGIFARYNRPLIMKLDQAETAGEGVSNAASGDIHEFDPL